MWKFLHAANKKPAMKLLHTLAIASVLAVFALPADAKNNGNNRQAEERAKKEKAEREKERNERKKVNEQVKDYLETRDKNKDNQISKEEFLLGETDKAKGESTFNEYNKNKDRVLNKKEIKELLGID